MGTTKNRIIRRGRQEPELVYEKMKMTKTGEEDKRLESSRTVQEDPRL